MVTSCSFHLIHVHIAFALSNNIIYIQFVRLGLVWFGLAKCNSIVVVHLLTAIQIDSWNSLAHTTKKNSQIYNIKRILQMKVMWFAASIKQLHHELQFKINLSNQVEQFQLHLQCMSGKSINEWHISRANGKRYNLSGHTNTQCTLHMFSV